MYEEDIDFVLKRYKDLFGFDLSYMAFKVDSQPVYTNGEQCHEYAEDECAGDWTELGWIRLNPDMKSVMDKYGVAWHGSGDVEEFTRIIIAHELAHELWNNVVGEDFKRSVLDKARRENFNTVLSEDGQAVIVKYLMSIFMATTENGCFPWQNFIKRND